jgi:hypothetical protein
MAASARQTITANSVAQEWLWSNAVPRTDVLPQFKEEQSLVSPKALRQTPALSENEPASIMAERAKSQETTMPLNLGGGIRRIDAVIGEIMPETVTIHCKLPNGLVSINLPPSLVPPELLNYGTPVKLSLADSHGIRAPIIESRNVEQQTKLPGQAEIEAWLDSI